jgi:ribosomal protein S27AE
MAKRATCAECGKRRVLQAWPDGRLLCGHCYKLYILRAAFMFTKLLVMTVSEGTFQREVKRQSEHINSILSRAMGEYPIDITEVKNGNDTEVRQMRGLPSADKADDNGL